MVIGDNIYNHIDKLEVGGDAITDPHRIKGEIEKFDQKLRTETKAWRPNFNFQGDYKITEEENEWIQRDFKEQEVLECLKLCAAERARAQTATL